MAEQIVNEFTVNRPIEEAWPIICDLERIAPCMPGAQLDEIEGDVYRGRVKVKLGPVTAAFKGEIDVQGVNDAGRELVLVASGKDTKGTSTAKMNLTANIREVDAGSPEAAIQEANQNVNQLNQRLDQELAERDPFDDETRWSADDAIATMEDRIMLNQALAEALECHR